MLVTSSDASANLYILHISNISYLFAWPQLALTGKFSGRKRNRKRALRAHRSFFTRHNCFLQGIFEHALKGESLEQLGYLETNQPKGFFNKTKCSLGLRPNFRGGNLWVEIIVCFALSVLSMGKAFRHKYKFVTFTKGPRFEEAQSNSKIIMCINFDYWKRLFCRAQMHSIWLINDLFVIFFSIFRTQL